VLWRRRGVVAGLRALGVTLLVPATYLTGTLRLLWEVGDAVVGWAARLVFSPVVWFGVSLAGVAVLVLVTAGLLARRGIGTGRSVPSRRRSRAVGAASGSGVGTGSAPAADDDLEDIEAILRRHGIS
jgi:hypothetical protein